MPRSTASWPDQYLLKSQVHVPRKLDMEITVQACVDRHFAEDWQAVWVETASNCIRI